MKKTHYYILGVPYRTLQEAIDETGISKYSMLQFLEDKNETDFEKISRSEYEQYVKDLIISECEAWVNLIKKLERRNVK